MGYIGLYKDNGKENGNYYNGLHRGYIGTMEKNMETTILLDVLCLEQDWPQKVLLHVEACCSNKSRVRNRTLAGRQAGRQAGACRTHPVQLMIYSRLAGSMGI